ncbi:DNA primase [Listeria monocytogenes]|nr:DNA primase [Listeria monocytogenes]EGI7484602.1 DNA primase [Listeria monocytogenes]EGI8576440.1 DNA primase [Listeria monocytogenes]EGJ1391553.1 DNA primase [Listeria monocytogenes]EGJ5783523.1 DNA primase [Listeria monocytogenes]
MLQNDLKVSITNVASTAAKNIAKAMNVKQPELHRFTVIHRDSLSIILINYPIQHLEYNYISYLVRSFEADEIEELIIITSDIRFIQDSMLWIELNKFLEEENIQNIQKEYEEELVTIKSKGWFLNEYI